MNSKFDILGNWKGKARVASAHGFDDCEISMAVTQKEENLFKGIGHFEIKGKAPMSAPISGVIESMNIHAASVFTLFFGKLKQAEKTWEIEGHWQTVSSPSTEDSFVPNVATFVMRKV